MKERTPVDVAIVGAGPAGLSAALWLARYGRTVRIYDAGAARNEPSWAVHGYPGIPDLPPSELRHRIMQQTLGAGAEIVQARVECVQGAKDAFTVEDDRGCTTAARRIVLAFGLQDRLPAIAELETYYGSSVFHCPDCDGPSMKDARVGVIGCDRTAANLALYLSFWASATFLLTNGGDVDLDEDGRATLERGKVTVHREKIRTLRGENRRLTAVEFENDDALELEGLFFHLGADPASALPGQLGCELDDDDFIRTDDGETSVEGVYAAGDITGLPHLAIAAAAEGVHAALKIHRSLLDDRLRI